MIKCSICIWINFYCGQEENVDNMAAAGLAKSSTTMAFIGRDKRSLPSQESISTHETFTQHE